MRMGEVLCRELTIEMGSRVTACMRKKMLAEPKIERRVVSRKSAPGLTLMSWPLMLVIDAERKSRPRALAARINAGLIVLVANFTKIWTKIMEALESI